VRHRENRLRKRDLDKKIADSTRILGEESAKMVEAGFPDITQMSKPEAHRVKIRHYVATNEALQGERGFFESIRDVSCFQLHLRMDVRSCLICFAYLSIYM
jgi:hypothetical protein